MATGKNPLHFIGLAGWEIPDPHDVANEEGLIALSWDLEPELYSKLYHYGIFPWFEQEGVVFWFSPALRSVTPVDGVKVAKSMRPFINKGEWQVKVNTDFAGVLAHCSEMPRPGQDGTWITEKFYDNFLRMHELGMAHSFEVWDGDELIGGTFGVMTGNVFVGESMFHTRPNASKYAYIGMCRHLESMGVQYVDNQIPTPHLSSLGAVDIERADWLAVLEDQSLDRDRTEVHPFEGVAMKKS